MKQMIASDGADVIVHLKGGNQQHKQHFDTVEFAAEYASGLIRTDEAPTIRLVELVWNGHVIETYLFVDAVKRSRS